jgi:hypothetical protein
MDIGSIFLILSLLILVTIYIIRPIIEHSRAAVATSRQDLSTLLAERDHVVATIQELDDDYNLGKVPVDEYPPQRQALVLNGADILRKIDEFQAVWSSRKADDRVEAAIIARRQNLEVPQAIAKKNGNAVPPVPDDDLEQKIASRRRSFQGKASGFCPKCGRPIHSTDRFCPRCGATLA